MASVGLVEDPRAIRHNWNHPSHPHKLIKVNSTELYPNYGAWKCDLCHKQFRGQHDSIVFPQEDSESPDPTHSYHCSLCGFDVCSQCFTGYLHPFHPHRLKQAKPELVYPVTDGTWKCDACQRIFNKDHAQLCYHCSECEVDLCQRCFIGDWRHVLHDHSNHLLKPIDPRIEYRQFLAWSCDNCEQRFSTTDNEILYHCSTCLYDLCTQCFRGKKHHLHQHRMVKIMNTTPQYVSTMYCSNCGRATSQYHQCCEPTCRYILCDQCHATPPKLHPSHTHPLEVCDAAEVYPQSGGLWHCDSCTATRGMQVPLPPSQPMYHCDICDYDMCKKCYSTNEQPDSETPYNIATSIPSYGTSNRPFYSQHQVSTSMDVQPNYRSHPLNFVSSYPRPTSPLSFMTSPSGPLSQGAPPPFNSMMCTMCRSNTATKRFVHGWRTCSVKPVVCQRCAQQVLNYHQHCPHCGSYPDSISDTAIT